MPHESRQFVKGEIYHIVIRRAGDKKLFLDTDDHYRGIFCLYEFNNAQSVSILRRRRRIRFLKNRWKREQSSPVPSLKLADERDRLVELLAFCFMPNHIHLLLKPLKEDGISKFMLKLESGYAAYFRSKYGIKIKGHFFQDRFKSVRIKTRGQLSVVFVYIHTNSLALIEPNWKEKGIGNPTRAIKFLEEEYRWSSFFDYLGKKNFPSVTERDFLLEIMGGPEGCKKAVEHWVKYKAEIKEFSELALESE